MITKIETLKKQLSDLGYYVYGFDSFANMLFVAKDLGGVNDFGGKNVKVFCRIEFIENEYRIYTIRFQIIDTIKFDSEQQVVEFVKSKFIL